MSQPYVTLLPHGAVQNHSSSCPQKSLQQQPLSKRFRSLAFGFAVGIVFLASLELFGRAAQQHTKYNSPISAVHLASAKSPIDECFVNVKAEQPFWLVFLSTYIKQFVSNMIFPINKIGKTTWRSVFLAIVFIAFAAKIAWNDISLWKSTPTQCLQIIGTGTPQMISILQSLLTAGIYSDHKVEDPWRWNLLYGLMCVTIPYTPLIALTFLIDIFPGLFIFFPVALVLFVVTTCAFGCWGVGHQKVGVMTEGNESATTTEEDSQILVQGMMAPYVLTSKFMGEVMARFWAGEGWVASISTTWAERSFAAYTGAAVVSFNSALNAMSNLI